MKLGAGRYGAGFRLALKCQNRVKEALRAARRGAGGVAGDEGSAARACVSTGWKRACRGGKIIGVPERLGTGAEPVRHTEHYALL